MASDKMRALLAFAKLAVAVAVGYGIYYIWIETRGDDEWWIPYGAWLVSTVMVFVLLSKQQGSRRLGAPFYSE